MRYRPAESDVPRRLRSDDFPAEAKVAATRDLHAALQAVWPVRDRRANSPCRHRMGA